ncbi:MAG: glycosyltransferase family 2 protein [Candidatus Amesbacteria bacterium]|nr:glycosyltransferase family 2 protein [Candidatus Amesbacteria bacterium]
MLSVVIVAWNEEKNLPRVVVSVKDFADEIVVVVDKGSIDKTSQVAKKLGCKVFYHEHTGIVEPIRAFAIAKAKNEWILLLDADEEISADLADKIKKIIADNKLDYIRIPRKNLIFGKWIKSDHWWPDYVYRLFKKNSLTWDNAIHSVPFTRGKGLDLAPEEKFSIIHHHYNSIFEYVDKINRYTDHQKVYRFTASDLITKPFDEFIRQYFARHGYRDGIHGLSLSLLQAFSELVLYLKLWQDGGFLPENIKPEIIDKMVNDKMFEFKWWSYQAKIDEANLFSKLWYKLARKLGI